MLLKQVSIWGPFIECSVLLVAKMDGTGMELNEGGSIIRTREVVARCLRAYKPDGSSLAIAPTLTFPPSLDALGVIAALRTEEWGIQKMCSDKSKWKGLLINFVVFILMFRLGL